MSGEFEDVMKRIKESTSARTQIDLATILDIRQSSISDAKRRGAVPPAWIMKLFEKYLLNPIWLKTGEGDQYLLNARGCSYDEPDEVVTGVMAEPGSKYAGAAKPYKPHKSSSGVETALYATSIQPGETAWTAVKTGLITIPKQFFRPGLLVISAESAGMEPVIRKNAYVGIDSAQKNVHSGELYAVSMPFVGLSIKRIFFNPDQLTLGLREELKDHPEVIIPVAEVENRIIGRVIWVMQNL